ncbi:MAG: SOS response-associated peptidase family protein, partial [Clostridiaceae bacterium]|nr:SOS response-associated peptidase family protein [Clostridiaceae bacterium]
MCGRYMAVESEDLLMKLIYDETRAKNPEVRLHSGEIFPTNTAPVIGGRNVSPFPAKWGYPQFNGKGVIINARAETADTKMTFKDSLRYRRCAIPTTGYLEWSQSKEKYRLNLPEGKLLYLAGFYQEFADGIRFVILTTAPNESVTDIHDRMPVILLQRGIGEWVNDREKAMKMMRSPMPPLVRMHNGVV